MRFNYTPEDFLKGQLVDQGWHPAAIIAVTEKTSKGEEKSQYLEVQFKIVAGPSTGVIVYSNFSEKAPSFIVPMLEALGAQIDKNKPGGQDVSESTLKNKTLDIMVKRGSYNNKPKNEIDGYRPFSGPKM